MTTIKAIEDAVITALLPLKTSLGVYTIKTYQDDLHFTDEEQIKKLAAAAFPALYVIYAGSGYESHGQRKIERPIITVFAADISRRTDDDEARRGSAANPGTYALIDGARDKLCGQQLGLGIWPLEVLRVMPVWAGDGISVYAIEFQTGQGHLYPA